MLFDDRLNTIKFLTPQDFLKSIHTNSPPVIVDIREKEKFDIAHIPGAINIPIFNKPQKKIIDTICDSSWTLTPYILAKIDKFITPYIKTYVAQLKSIISQKENFAKKSGQRLSDSDKTILVYCWRGGPYSEGFAILLKEYGLRVRMLKGGYLRYQAHMNTYLLNNYSFKVVGGHIGSGKTAILYELQKAGEQILDLDKCTNQKTTRSYLTSIGLQLSFLNPDTPIWVEEKTRKPKKYLMLNRGVSLILETENGVGYGHSYNNSFWEQIKTAPIYRLELPLQLRLKRIIAEHAQFAINELKEKAIKLIEHLGNEKYTSFIKCLESGNFNESAEIILKYYDSYYNKTMHKRSIGKETRITLQEDAPEITAKLLIKEANKDKS